MNDRKIQFLKPTMVAVKKGDKYEKVLFGMAEYLMQNSLMLPHALTPDFLPVTRLVARLVEPWLGRDDQEKFALTLSEGQWEKFCKLVTPREPLDPRYLVPVTDVLDAIYNAAVVPLVAKAAAAEVSPNGN